MERSFNIKLAELLQEKGYTQKELANMAGVTEAAVSHYIKGDRIPRASVLKRIADALGTSVDYLMNGNETDGGEIQYATRLIARNVRQMSKKEKMDIIKLLLDE